MAAEQLDSWPRPQSTILPPRRTILAGSHSCLEYLLLEERKAVYHSDQFARRVVVEGQKVRNASPTIVRASCLNSLAEVQGRKPKWKQMGLRNGRKLPYFQERQGPSHQERQGTICHERRGASHQERRGLSLPERQELRRHESQELSPQERQGRSRQATTLARRAPTGSCLSSLKASRGICLELRCQRRQ